MAIVINTALCPLLIEAGFTTTQIKNQVLAKRASLSWWLKDMDAAERKKLCTAIWNLINSEEPQNCGTTYDISRRLGYPEPLVRSIMDQIFAVAKDTIEQADDQGL